MLEKLSDFKFVDGVDDFAGLLEETSGGSLVDPYPVRAGLSLPFDSASECESAELAYVPRLIDAAWLIEAVTERRSLTQLCSASPYIDLEASNLTPRYSDVSAVELFVKSCADHWMTGGVSTTTNFSGYFRDDVEPPTEWTKLGPAVSVEVSRWVNSCVAGGFTSLSSAYQYASNLYNDTELFPDGAPYQTTKELIETLRDCELYDFVSPELTEGIRPETDTDDDGNEILKWEGPDEDFVPPENLMYGKCLAAVYSDLERMTTCVVSLDSTPSLRLTGSDGTTGEMSWLTYGFVFNKCRWGNGYYEGYSGSTNYSSHTSTYNLGFNSYGRSFVSSLPSGDTGIMLGKSELCHEDTYFIDDIPATHVDINWIVSCLSNRMTYVSKNRVKDEFSPDGQATVTIPAAALGDADELSELVETAWLGLVAQCGCEEGEYDGKGGISPPSYDESGQCLHPFVEATKVTGTLKAGVAIRFVEGRLEGTDLKFDIDVSDLPDAESLDADVSRTYEGEEGDPDGFPSVLKTVVEVPCEGDHTSHCYLSNCTYTDKGSFSSSYSRLVCMGPLIVRYRPRTLTEE